MNRKHFSDLSGGKMAHRNLSRIYIASVRRLHFLLLLATMVPSFSYIATLNMPGPDAAAAAENFVPLYLFTLTASIPAALFYLIQERVPNLVVFLLCACPVFMVYLACAFSIENLSGLSIQGAERVPQALILLLFLLDAIRMRTNDNSRRKAKAQMDHSWAGDVYLLPLPTLKILIAFAVIYVGALFLHSNGIALAALLGAILYFFLVLPYHVQVRKDAFLESRHHLSRVPKEQIESLLHTTLLQILIPCALLALTALMTSGRRHFLDLPKLRLTILPEPVGYAEPGQSALLRELMELGLLQKGAPPPEWLIRLIDFVENALTLFMTVVLVYGAWRIVRGIWLRFLKEENEKLPAPSRIQMQDEHISLKKPRRKMPPPGRQGRIRRRYQRMILHYRSSAPEIFETPSMMEARSGVPDTPQTRILHDAYEKARYAPAGREQ